jgi:acetate kinase
VRVLVVNAGSSSLKLRLLAPDDTVLETTDAPPPADDGGEALAAGIGKLGPIDAVGHRVVHGGERFDGPVRIDEDVARELEALTALAPLHQPKSLAAYEAVRDVLPDVPAVACFDTAFHATMPESSATFAVPREWRTRWGVRRYGFHGLSHAHVARRAAELVQAPADGLRIVSCHLGAGASVTAIQDGRSVDTTMGFTPNDGLAMATRSGSVDPGLLVWLLERQDMSVSALGHVLEHESGLTGLAGTGDMREVLARAGSGDEDATLALGVFLHRLRAAIASMAAAMDGLDVLVFTGGIGARAGEVRRRAADGLGFLGVSIDAAANGAASGDAEVGADGSPVRTLVIADREDLEIARGVRAVLGADAADKVAGR